MLTNWLDDVNIRAVLQPRDKRRLFPAGNDPRWQQLPQEKKENILTWAAQAVDEGYPMLTATQFLAFVRTGSRKAYEDPYFIRRKNLIGAVLAECVQPSPATLDAVVDGVWCILEETFWGISAHNGSHHDGMPPPAKRPLPDPNNISVDLFAAQTGTTLALTAYLLRDRLDNVAPVIVRRIEKEMDRRIFTPFMTRDDFWWMGFTRKELNNWTPWILSSILVAAQYLMDDDIRLSQLMARANMMLMRYLDCLPEDGGCDEGPAYWNMAGGALLDCLESLHEMTAGAIDVYQEDKIQRIGLFPWLVHLGNGWFANFSDCDARVMLNGERVYRYGELIDSAPLMQLGAGMMGPLRPNDTPQMNRVLHQALRDIAPSTLPEPVAHMDLPQLQWWTRTAGGLSITIKGGHNDESHNHNDVGSFILMHRREPVLVDVGNVVYTAKTFSEERYTLWHIRSRNHNVPLIGNQEQLPGRAYRARDVVADEHAISMDISSAYPKQAGVTALARRVDTQGGHITLSDHVRLKNPDTVTWVFMARHCPQVVTPGVVRIAGVTMHMDPHLSLEVEEIAITDDRMNKSYPGSVWRMACTSPAQEEHSAQFTFEGNS